MKKTKGKIKFWQSAAMAFAVLFVAALTFGITSAWFEYREKVKGSIEFAPGILASLSGVDISGSGEDKEYYLMKVDNPKRQDLGSRLDITGAMPADEWTIVNPTITPTKDNYGSETAPYVLRIRLEMYADDETEPLGDLAVNRVIDIMPKFAENWIKGEDGWYYYTKKTASEGWTNQLANYNDMYINEFKDASEQTSVQVFGTSAADRKLKLSEDLYSADEFPYTSIKFVLRIEGIQATKDAFEPWALSKSERAITDWNEALANMYTYDESFLFTSVYDSLANEYARVEGYYLYDLVDDEKANEVGVTEENIWWSEGNVNYKGNIQPNEKWVTEEKASRVLDTLTSTFGLTPVYENGERASYEQAVEAEMLKHDYANVFGSSFASTIYIDGRKYIPVESSYSKTKEGVSTFTFENTSSEGGIQIRRKYDVTIVNAYIEEVVYTEENITAGETGVTTYTIVYNENLKTQTVTNFETLYASKNGVEGYKVVPNFYNEYAEKVELTVKAVCNGEVFNLATVGKYGDITTQSAGEISYLVDVNAPTSIFFTPEIEGYELEGVSTSLEGELITDESASVDGYQYTIAEQRVTLYVRYNVVVPTEFEVLMAEARENAEQYQGNVLVFLNEYATYLNFEKGIHIDTLNGSNIQKGAGDIYYQYMPEVNFKVQYTGDETPENILAGLKLTLNAIFDEIEAGITEVLYNIDTAVTKLTYTTATETRYAEFLNGYLIKDYSAEGENIAAFYGNDAVTRFEEYQENIQANYIPENINNVKIGVKIKFETSPVLDAEVRVNGVVVSNITEGKYVPVAEPVVLSASKGGYDFTGWKVTGTEEFLTDADLETDGFQFVMGMQEVSLTAYFTLAEGQLPPEGTEDETDPVLELPEVSENKPTSFEVGDTFTVNLEDFTVSDETTTLTTQDIVVVVKRAEEEVANASEGQDPKAWSYLLEERGVYSVTYSVSDEAGNTTTLTYQFTVGDVTNPTLTLAESSANEPTTFNVGDTFIVNLDDFTVTDDVTTTLTTQDIAVVVRNKDTHEDVVNASEGQDPKAWSYTFAVAGNYSVEYSVKDEAGNETKLTYTFTVEEPAGQE